MNRTSSLAWFIVSTSALTGCGLENTEVVERGWALYEDARFDYRLYYPPGWAVDNRGDKPGEIETLIFRGPLKDDGTAYKIFVGHYTTEIEAAESLPAWKDRSRDRLAPNIVQDLEPLQSLQTTRGELDAAYFRGTTNLTEYQTLNIRKGKLVWFMWSNIGPSAAPALREVFETLAASFMLGEETPGSLEQIYGPVDREENAPPEFKLGSSWWSPLYGLWYISCGSSEHGGASYYAADMGMAIGQPIYSSQSGTIAYYGWTDIGYGNLVQIDYSSSRRHVYAHLDKLNGGHWVGRWVGRSTYLGTSGDTGNGPAHLHFHVQNGGTAVDLAGMSHFTAWSGWPTTGACGYFNR